MYDSYGRCINYLRISVTDRCNFRCKYCMPEDGLDNKLEHSDILSFEDMIKIVRVFSKLGISKIRLTGGEPLVRKGIIDFISKIKEIDGIEEITMTTNAYFLEDYALELKEAGLDRVNVSLDSLDKDKFKEITRGGDLDKVLKGLEKAKEVGLLPIKINAVLVDGFNIKEIRDLINLTYKGIDVRFIELMPIGSSSEFAENNFLSNDRILDEIKELKKIKNEDKSSPATYYRLNDALGRVGLIDPITCKFCENCNRLRLTSTGMLRTCLHSDREINLAEVLDDFNKLEEIIIGAVSQKEEAHHIENKEYICTNMNQIGG